jgi:hypothetical protein
MDIALVLVYYEFWEETTTKVSDKLRERETGGADVVPVEELHSASRGEKHCPKTMDPPCLKNI